MNALVWSLSIAAVYGFSRAVVRRFLSTNQWRAIITVSGFVVAVHLLYLGLWIPAGLLFVIVVVEQALNPPSK